MNEDYNEAFYCHMGQEARNSAKKIVPRLLQLFKIHSVVDVGCGTGSWAAEFARHGVSDIVGVDGDFCVGTTLEIPQQKFFTHDLAQPLELDRRFDLAVCLEVAEHLPPDAAPQLIDALTSHSDTVLFSAAIPRQGGTAHLNEQWLTYWHSFFNERGYAPLDFLRWEFWSDPKIAWWYRQNMVLFQKREAISQSLVKQNAARTSADSLHVVHPEVYLNAINALDRARRLEDDISSRRLIEKLCKNVVKRWPRDLRKIFTRIR